MGAAAPGSTTTLFRLNSMASKVIKQCSALAGAQFLLETLAPPVELICSNPTGMEVRLRPPPLAVLARWLAGPWVMTGLGTVPMPLAPVGSVRARSQVDPNRLDVGDDLQAHQVKLQAACQHVVNSILAARPAMPPQLVDICRLLYREVNARFPGSGGQAVGMCCCVAAAQRTLSTGSGGDVIQD